MGSNNITVAPGKHGAMKKKAIKKSLVESQSKLSLEEVLYASGKERISKDAIAGLCACLYEMFVEHKTKNHEEE